MKNNKFLVIGGIIAVVFFLIAYSIYNNRGSGSASEKALATPTTQIVPQSALAVTTATPLATATIPPSPTPEDDLSCEADCMWSTLCVTGHYTIPEKNGQTRVQPNSCIPVNFSKWYIRPDDPFAGMPCSIDDKVCMWSLDCVRDYNVPAVKNGLAKVMRDSCTIVP